MNLPHITFIILNWNGWENTIECLESLYQIKYPNYNVILVDNGSKDESIQKIKEYCDGKILLESKFFDFESKNKPIKFFEYNECNLERFNSVINDFKSINSDKKIVIIKNFDNKGYTEGNNIGIRFALKYFETEYMMILNNDIVVDSFFVNELIAVAKKNPDVGILGPVNLSYYQPDKIQVVGAKINLWTGGWKPIKKDLYSYHKSDALEVDFVIGAAIMIKVDVIKKIGFFKKIYFANWEETDYCFNAKKFSFKVISVPESKIWHKESSSISQYNPTRIYLILRNNLIFMRRNAAKKYWPSFLLFYLFLRVPSFILYGIKQNSIRSSFKLVHISIEAIIDGLTLSINEFE